METKVRIATERPLELIENHVNELKISMNQHGEAVLTVDGKKLTNTYIQGWEQLSSGAVVAMVVCTRLDVSLPAKGEN